MKFLQENALSRKMYMPVRGKTLKVPIYFPSISSVKTGLSPFDYLKVLKALKHSHYLVSAYDVDKSFRKDHFIKALNENIINDGAVILMDSGNYESYWLRDKAWSIEDFNEILQQEVCDLAFCFDNQFPPATVKDNATWIATSTMKSQAVSKASTIIPIIHCKRHEIIETTLELYSQTSSVAIALPERILGEGLIERIETVTNLRKELNKLDNYVFIHLLGTGNPLSLLLLSLAGADSFDGLEWCQTVVNPSTALLFHFQQREMFNDNCSFCNDLNLDYTSKTLAHNLLFYSSWMKEIQDALESQSFEILLARHFESSFVKQLQKIWE